MSDKTPPFSRLLAVFAHPDDEAFTCGGMFAALSDRGVTVTLVCATRGEAGEILVPDLATRETLGAIREAELRQAMAAVGVSDVRFLDYLDSGMIGTAENDAPHAFMQVPVPEVAAKIVTIIDELRPEVVVTFGPDGIYGHPDHIAIYRATTAAVLSLANRPDDRRPTALYYGTAPRERFVAMGAQPNTPFSGYSAEQLNQMGTPRAEITHVLDITPWLERKRAAMTAHRSQFGDDGPVSQLPREQVDDMLRTEHFLRVPLPWDATTPPADPLAEAFSLDLPG